MSLYRWFAPSKQAPKPYLPDPSKEGTEKDALEVEAANQRVEGELGRKRRGKYNHYDPVLRAKIGKYAATSGNVAAVKKFSEQLRKPISESTVRDFTLLLGDLDVNRAIVISAATGIVEYNNPALLCAHGGPIELGKKWADSILGRMGLVKRKATKAARKLPVDFADVKLQRQL